MENSGAASAMNLHANREIFYEYHGAVLAIVDITTWHKLIPGSRLVEMQVDIPAFSEVIDRWN